MAAVAAVLVVIASRTLASDIRLWLPFLYIGAGYWIPVLLVAPTHGGRFEVWLRQSDAAARRFAVAMPPWLAAAMEIGYLSCFPLVPVAFGAMWDAGSTADVERFWTAVLAAAFASYGPLPWLVSRPPRLLEDAPQSPRGSVARANVFVLGRVSHNLNTFPSGHVAVATAAAIAVGAVWPAAGAALGVVAMMIAIGAVAGGYHYVADVVLGAIVGAAATLI